MSRRSEYRRGLKVEREHLAALGGDRRALRRLVRDHLREHRDYYSRLARCLGRRRKNPLVRYHAEKGPAVKKTSGWKTLEGAGVSNTYWSRGDLDFGGKLPRVFVGPEELDAAAWRRSPGSKVTTYLLHPDKWSGGIASALGMMPNIARGPDKPIAYAKRVRYDVPVKLHSEPGRDKNPRAWFEARGTARYGRVIGHTVIRGSGKRVPIYDEIVVE